MHPPLSRIAQQLTGSSVVDNRRKADALAAKGIDIVDFGAGEPDFQAPAAVVQEALRSINAGQGHYIDPRGLPELRDGIAAFETARHGYPVSPDAVVVTTGSFGALSISTRALLDPGDEVLIPEPFWGPYRNIVRLVGAIPVPVPGTATQGRFAVNPDALRARVTPHTRALVINSPNNPTGRVLTRGELTAIADIAVQNNLWIFADEVYSELLFEGATHVSIAALAPEVASRTVVANSLSKTFAMTGWRLGYCLAPAAAAEVMARINHYTVRCPTSFVQYAAVAGLRGAWNAVEQMRQTYLVRRALVLERLQRLPGVEIAAPEGTFYAFPRIPEAWGNGRGFANRLLDEAGVLVSPGSAYGPSAAQHIRISFATSEAKLREGFDRIDRLVART